MSIVPPFVSWIPLDKERRGCDEFISKTAVCGCLECGIVAIFGSLSIHKCRRLGKSPPSQHHLRIPRLFYNMPNLVRDSSFCFAKKTWTLGPATPQSIKGTHVPLKNFTAEELPRLVADFERHGIRGPPSGSHTRTPSSFCSRDSFSNFLKDQVELLPPSQRGQQPCRMGQYVVQGHWIFHYLHPNQDEEDPFDWNSVRERRASSVFSREDTPMYPYNPSMMHTIPEAEANGYHIQQGASLPSESTSLALLDAALRVSTPLQQATPKIAQVPSRKPSVNVRHQQPTAPSTHDTPATTGPPVTEPPQGRRYPTRDRHPPKPRYDPIIPARRSTRSTPLRSSPTKATLAKTKEAA